MCWFLLDTISQSPQPHFLLDPVWKTIHWLLVLQVKLCSTVIDPLQCYLWSIFPITEVGWIKLLCVILCGNAHTIGACCPLWAVSPQSHYNPDQANLQWLHNAFGEKKRLRHFSPFMKAFSTQTKSGPSLSCNLGRSQRSLWVEWRAGSLPLAAELMVFKWPLALSFCCPCLQEKLHKNNSKELDFL